MSAMEKQISVTRGGPRRQRLSVSPAVLIQNLVASPGGFGLPKVKGARPMPGGLVHHVWQIETEGARFYAKIRAKRFSRVPEIHCEPRDIKYEARAISLFSNLAPDLFPRIVHSSPDDGLLIMTDVVAEGQILEKLLLAGEITPQIARCLGGTLRRIHDRAKSKRTAIRGDLETVFARTKLEHKLGPAHHPATPIAMRRLADGLQLIIGDPSPKNIAYHAQEESFTFFDLEDAHRGHPSFDTGFLIGHFLLHNYLDATTAERLVTAFWDGYKQHPDDDLAQFVAAATFHYRLNSVIPYCVSPSSLHRVPLLRNATAILTLLSRQCLTWRNLTRRILSLTNPLPEAAHD